MTRSPRHSGAGTTPKIDNLLPSSEGCTAIGIVVVIFRAPSVFRPKSHKDNPPCSVNRNLPPGTSTISEQSSSSSSTSTPPYGSNTRVRAGERLLAGEESMSAEKRPGESAADSSCRADIVSTGKVGAKSRCVWHVRWSADRQTVREWVAV